MHRPLHLLDRRLEVPPDDELGDQLRRVRAHDVRTQDLRVLLVADDLHEPVRVAGRNSATDCPPTGTCPLRCRGPLPSPAPPSVPTDATSGWQYVQFRDVSVVDGVVALARRCARRTRCLRGTPCARGADARRRRRSHTRPRTFVRSWSSTTLRSPARRRATPTAEASPRSSEFGTRPTADRT